MRKSFLRSIFVQRFLLLVAVTALVGLPLSAAETSSFHKESSAQISTPIYQTAPAQGIYAAHYGMLDSEALPEAPSITTSSMPESDSESNEADETNSSNQTIDPIRNQISALDNTTVANPAEAYSYNFSQGLFPAESKQFGHWFVDGWVSAGGSTNNSSWPMSYAAGTRGDNGVNNANPDFGMNQFYVSFGRQVSKEGGVDIGVQADLLYGTDYLPVSSLGLESHDTRSIYNLPAQTVYQTSPRWNQNSLGGYSNYGLAMPQLYGELYAPIMSGFTVKGGHFYSPLGYESFPSPSNFFYTHSYSMLYGEAKTVTGLLAELALNDQVSIFGGFSNGWDSWTDNDGKMDVLAGAKWQSWDKNSTLSFMLMSGDAVANYTIWNPQYAAPDSVNTQRTNYSLVFQRRLAENVTYVLQHDLGVTQNGAYKYNNFNMSTYDASWYSVINYLYIDLDPCMSLGFRAEWFKDYGYSRIWGAESSNMYRNLGYQWKGDNFVDLSLGLNWRPNNWLTIRPEVRWDYSDMHLEDAQGNELSKGIYDDLAKDNMVTFGGDVLVRF